MMIRYLTLFSAIILIIIYPAVAAEATEISGSSNIENISVGEKDSITEIRIEVDSAFQYGAYTLSDPHRIVVTLNGVSLGRFTDKIFVGRSGVVEIAPAEIENPHHFARLDITLSAPVQKVKPSLKGNSLVLSVSTTTSTALSSEVKKQEEKQNESESVNSGAPNREVKKEEDFKKEREKYSTTVMVRTPFGGYISKEVLSIREMRFKGIIHQRYDFSCGAASMATLLRYVYNVEDISEEKIAEEMIEIGDPELIRKKGFSLLDMKKYAERHGFQANGYKVEAEKLLKIKIPTIILLDTRGYKHFVVLKGMKDGRVYLADPAAGNRSTNFDEFVKSWDGVVFVVYKKTDVSDTLALNEAMKVPVDNVLWINEVGMRNYVPLRGEF